MLNGPGLGGLFLATFFNAASLLAVLLDLGQSFYVPRSTHTIHARAIEHQADEPEAEEIEQDTEITPLLRDDVPGVPAEKETGEDDQPWVLCNLVYIRYCSAYTFFYCRALWIVEFLLLVHTHGVIVLQVILFILAALSQTLADGSPPGTGT